MEGGDRMDKREMLFNLAENRKSTEYVPAAFFLHFDSHHHRGQAAVNKHLEFFRSTGMDLVKIQYEHPFPTMPQIREPADWSKMELLGSDYFAPPLEVVSGIAKAAKKEAVVVVTLYSALMLAAHATSRELLNQHLEQDPAAVAKGLRAIDESLLVFARGCIAAGADGFYMSTQGGEAGRFSDPALFSRFIKPVDLALMREVHRLSTFTILHVCDYHGAYDDLSPYLDYPGTIVNCATRMQSDSLSPRRIADMFGRPFMGGMDRHGVLVTGSRDEIQREVREVIGQAPDRFMLGADCTVPSDIPWDNLKAAIDAAHG
jgi:uroporphyrinogen decarboxylase